MDTLKNKNEQVAYPTEGRRCVASSGSIVATDVGLNVLKTGGNAADACIAMNSILGLALPMSTGLGGDLFILYYSAQDNRVYSLNGGGTAPIKSGSSYYNNLGLKSIPMTGIISAAVPANVKGCFILSERFGSIPIKYLWKPAIQFAMEGIEVTPQLSKWLGNCYNTAKLDNRILSVYYKNEQPYEPGEKIVQVQLGKTMEKISEKGCEYFYNGDIADKIVRESDLREGLFTRADFENFDMQFEEPISVKFNGKSIYQNPLPSQGIMMLMALKVIDKLNIENETEFIHFTVEAMKCINELRANLMGDPKFVNVEVDNLLSDDMTNYIIGRISKEKASRINKNDYNYFFGDTTYYYAIDSFGNVCSCISSLSLGFGAGVYIQDTGIILNSRVGRGFVLNPAHPNRIQGGKRPINTLGSFIVTDGNSQCISVGGTPGGDGQIQWNVQTLYKALKMEQPLEFIFNQPRWTFIPGVDPSESIKEVGIKIEDSLDTTIIKELEQRGHTIKLVPRFKAGGGSHMALNKGDRWICSRDVRQEGSTKAL